jgi:hypothetical protein
MEDVIQTVKARMQEAVAWVNGNCESNDFAKSLKSYLEKKGALTVGQAMAALRSVDRAKLAENAPEVSTSAFERLFETAKSNGLKRPKLTIGDFRFSPAPDNGANAGAIYVKQEGVYLGKMMRGRFMAAVAGDHINSILRIANDPLGAAVAHGKLTGHCAVCSRLLSDPDSVERGIGPVCATKFGW